MLVPAAVLAEPPASDEEYTWKPLVGHVPAWWTPEVQAAAEAAGLDGNLLNPITGESTAPAGGIPAGSPDYLFVRPGALMISPFVCTLNFVYASGTQIGTAGHCAGAVGQDVFIVAVPTVPLIAAVGRVASFHNAGVGDDWALIDINPFWWDWVDPNMAYLGGPSCSAWNGASSPAGKHVGHGIQTGVVAAVPRVSTMGASNGRSFTGAGEVSGGDSGSPIIQVASGANCAGGAAGGIITHCSTITGIECLPLYAATDIRIVPATVTPGFDPL